MKNNAILEFDSATVGVFKNNATVRFCPASVIRKASDRPVGIMHGEEAEMRMGDLPESSVYSRPFERGRIKDSLGARILFKALLRDACGPNRFVNVFVVVPSDATVDERRETERILNDIGYRNVFLVPRDRIIARLLRLNGMHCAIAFDNDICELVLAKDGAPVESRAYDASASAIADRIRTRFLTRDRLKITPSAALKTALEICSLFETDETPAIVEGVDTITSDRRLVCFCAKDLYPIADGIYSHAVSIVKAVINDCPDRSFARSALEKGALFLGRGAEISGLSEYASERLGAPCVICRNRSILSAALYSLAENDPDWVCRNAA